MRNTNNNPWRDVKLQLPIPFDLCLLDIGDKKALSGWWTGQGWDGLKYDGQQVYYWKKFIT